jgi:hydrogenase maturation protease
MSLEFLELFNMQTETVDILLESPQTNRQSDRRVLVIGIGNILLKDEGIGVHVVGQLQKQDLPGNVEVIDGGTAGLDILLSQKDLYKLVVIDAINAGGEPGTVYKCRFKSNEKDRFMRVFNRSETSQVSLHQVGLLDALKAAEKMKCEPDEVVLIGIEPLEISPGLELTTQVRQSIPRVVEEVLKEIEDVVHRE